MTTENTPDLAAPDTIVLVHGLWVTPAVESTGSVAGPRGTGDGSATDITFRRGVVAETRKG
jgi:hypothetical protein